MASVPVWVHIRSGCFTQYNVSLKFTRPMWSQDLLFRSAVHTGSEHTEQDIIQMLHEPLQTKVSLYELKEASEQVPVLSQLCTFFRNGWHRKVSEEHSAFSRVKDELSCSGFCPECPSRVFLVDGAQRPLGHSEAQTEMLRAGVGARHRPGNQSSGQGLCSLPGEWQTWPSCPSTHATPHLAC